MILIQYFFLQVLLYFWKDIFSLCLIVPQFAKHLTHVDLLQLMPMLTPDLDILTTKKYHPPSQIDTFSYPVQNYCQILSHLGLNHCFLHQSIPQKQHNDWHKEGIQLIFIEWINAMFENLNTLGFMFSINIIVFLIYLHSPFCLLLLRQHKPQIQLLKLFCMTFKIVIAPQVYLKIFTYC